MKSYFINLGNVDKRKFSVINTRGGETEIRDAVYLSYSGESNGNSGNIPTKNIKIPEKKGSVIIVQKTSNTTDVIKFSYSKNFKEILNGKNEETTGTAWINWLEDKDKKATEENKKMYIALSQKVYDSLKSENPYKELYTTDDTYLYRKYLNLRFEKKYAETNEATDSRKIIIYSTDEREAIATNAEKYLYQAVEYQKYKEMSHKKDPVEILFTQDKLLYKEGDKIYNDYFTEKINSLRENNDCKGVEEIGNALPYCENGTDTPEKFNKKMIEMMQKITQNHFSTTLPQRNDNRELKIQKYILNDKGIDNRGLLKNVTGKFGSVTDFNKIEEELAILSDLTMVTRGDILVLKDKDGNITETGIVIGVPNLTESEKKTFFGKNESRLFSQIQAVFVDADTQYVTVLSMDELKEKIPEGTIIAERLIKGVENTSAYLEAAKDQDWNIEDIKPYSYNVRIGTMRETTQMNKEKYRWIPNTGEYLELSDIYILLKNKIGVNITRTDINIRFAGLQDRDYSLDLEAKHGNIYKNKASSFMAKLYGSGKEIKTEKQVTRNSEGIYEYRNDESDGEITVNPMGKLMYGNQPLVVAVRPINANSAYPGDDFLLRFNIVSKLTNNIVESFNSSEEDYVAVYDKKMLWRANLYIDEGEATNDKGKKVSIDWNDIHPWNVPPSGSEGGPEWWNASDWGNNEWNRSLIVENYKDNIFEGLNTLPVGNGGQVTDFVSFTPLRPIAGTMAAPDTNKNVISNTVAYNFPDHAKEEGTGDAGSMDSPFDFNKKMLVQQLQLNKWYDANGVKKETAGTEYDSSSYGELNAPSNSWYHYELSTTSNFKYDEYEAAFIPGIGNFIYYGVSYAQNVLLSGETGDKEQIKKNFAGNDLKGKNGVYEAGTDCVGFANRAASYNNSIYKWTKTQPGWTEYENGTGTNNLKLTHNNYSRTYPRTAKDKYSNGVSVGESGKVAVNIFTTRGGGYDDSAYVDLSELGLLDSRDLEDKKQLLKIVPGDIFVKCSTGKKETDNEMDSHIAIVASVPSNAEELTVGELLDSIILIEAEISWRVQSVIKTFSLGDYGNKDGLSESLYKKIYPNADCTVWLEDNVSFAGDKWVLNNRHYAIRRLICKEKQ